MGCCQLCARSFCSAAVYWPSLALAQVETSTKVAVTVSLQQWPPMLGAWRQALPKRLTAAPQSSCITCQITGARRSVVASTVGKYDKYKSCRATSLRTNRLISESSVVFLLTAEGERCDSFFCKAADRCVETYCFLSFPKFWHGPWVLDSSLWKT